MADRYAYLPFVGLFIMVTWGIADFAQQRRLARAWLAVPACAVLMALALLSYRQISYWSDDVVLWTHTLEITTGNYAAENELADALDGKGRTEEAQQHFLHALAINPNYPPALMYLAVHNQREGKLRAAIAQYQQVIVIKPRIPRIRTRQCRRLPVLTPAMPFAVSARSRKRAITSSKRSRWTRTASSRGLITESSPNKSGT